MHAYLRFGSLVWPCRFEALSGLGQVCQKHSCTCSSPTSSLSAAIQYSESDIGSTSNLQEHGWVLWGGSDLRIRSVVPETEQRDVESLKAEPYLFLSCRRLHPLFLGAREMGIARWDPGHQVQHQRTFLAEEDG